MRGLVFMGALALGLILGSARADACSCTNFTKPNLAGQSEVVFTGRAIGQAGILPGTMRFDVALVYKGAVARAAQVQVGTGGGAACAGEFTLGARYTVFARDYDGDGVLNTNTCFRNVSGDIDPAEYGLPPALPAPGSGPGDLALALGAVAVTGLAALFVARSAGSLVRYRSDGQMGM